MKILIADDNAGFRALLRDLLSDLTTDIEEAGNGEEAVIAYSRNHPDFVLMDLRMEPMDGIAATKAILAHDHAARVVVVSTFDDEALREAAHKAGACGYATKDDLSVLKTIFGAV